MRLCFILSALLLNSTICQAQSKDDSSLLEIVRAGFLLANTHSDSAMAIGNLGIQQSNHSGNKKLAAYSYKTRGWAWLRMGNYDSSFKDLLYATRLFQELKDTIEIMYNYLNLADVYSSHSMFTESVSYLLRADSLAKNRNDTRVEAGIKKQLAILYREQGDYKKAASHFRESISLYNSIRDTSHYLDAVTSLSINYNEMSKPDSSLILLKQAYPVLIAHRSSNYHKAMFSERFGDTYFNLASYEEALKSYQQAYNYFASDNNYGDKAFEAINIGKTFMKLKQYKEAEKFLLQGYHINDSLHLPNYSVDAAAQLADLYKTMSNYSSAYRWLELKEHLQDSLNISDQNQKTAELETKYETEKKDKEINLLKKDQLLSALSQERQRTFRYGAVIVIALLALIGILFINRYRIVQRSRRLVEIEKLRNNIARDLHDDMGSALSSINILSKVVLASPAEKQNIDQHLKKIQDHSGSILESMSDIVWTINPINDTFEKVIFKMKEFAADILEPMNIQYEFILSENLSQVQLDLNQRKNLYLIFKEAINNAAKYSECSKVDIHLYQQNGQLMMQVKDNGKGFNIAQEQGGNGLKNIKQRAGELDGSAGIDSELGKGTLVSVQVRIT